MSWEFVKLGTLVELVTKGTTPTSVGFGFTETGVNFVKIESIDLNGQFIPSKFAKINSICHSSLSRSQLKEGDILFSIAGALGRTAIVRGEILPANTNQALAIIRLKDESKIRRDFLLRVLSSESVLTQLATMKGGVAQQNLSLSQIKEFSIPVPPLTTQHKIVAKLDAIFAEIDKALLANEANVKNAEALWQSTLNNIDTEFNGEIQELGSCVDLLSGFAFKSSEYTNNIDDIPLLRGENLGPNNIDFSEVKRFPKEKLNDYIKFSLNENDIVLGMDRPLISSGLRICKISKKDTPSLLVQRVMRMRCKQDIDSDFILFMLNSSKFIRHLLGEQTGLGVPHISGKTISTYKMKIPNIYTQKQLVVKLTNIFRKLTQYVDSKNKLSDQLNYLRNSILKQAFNGELVKD